MPSLNPDLLRTWVGTDLPRGSRSRPLTVHPPVPFRRLPSAPSQASCSLPPSSGVYPSDCGSDPLETTQSSVKKLPHPRLLHALPFLPSAQTNRTNVSPSLLSRSNLPRMDLRPSAPPSPFPPACQHSPRTRPARPVRFHLSSIEERLFPFSDFIFYPEHHRPPVNNCGLHGLSLCPPVIGG